MRGDDPWLPTELTRRNYPNVHQSRKTTKQKIIWNNRKGVHMLKLETILKNDANYNAVFSKYYQMVKKDFDVKDKYIKFDIGNNEVVRMKVAHFLVNLVLWKPFLYFKKPFDKAFLFDAELVNAGSLASYMDMVIDEFITEDNHVLLNECKADMMDELGWFSLDFNMIIGNTINLHDRIQLAKRNPKYRELIHRKYDTSMPTDEIERLMKEDTAELLKILEEEENCFRDYIRAKEGVNKDQLTQFEINVGPKPDLKGNVFPMIVNTNFLVDGLQSASDYFIDSSGGRKAAIINFGQVKKAGYTMRKLSLLCMNTLLNFEDKDCGTTNFMSVHIDSKKTLERFNKRYYRKGKKDVRISSKDTDLIGQIIMIRSSITCASKTICRKCYGDLAFINRDIHAGILGIEELTSRLTQMMLSAKHLLKTNSETINWTNEFLELFAMDANAVIVNPALDNESRYALIIEESMLSESEDISGGSDEEGGEDEFSFDRYMEKIKVRISEGGKNGKVRFWETSPDKKLFISPFLEEIMKTAVKDDEGTITIPFKDLEFSEPLFFLEIENNELATHLNNILKLIDHNEHLDVENKEEMLQKFIELLNESGIDINSIHIENVIRELIRRQDDITQRPDFGQDNPDYRMLRVSDAIMHSNSIIISMSFEKIKKQLYEPETYRKTAPSFLDKLFN